MCQFAVFLNLVAFAANLISKNKSDLSPPNFIHLTKVFFIDKRHCIAH